MSLDIDLKNYRLRELLSEVEDAITKATQAYKDGDPSRMDAYLRFADIKSNLLIAERLDMLIKVYNAKTE